MPMANTRALGDVIGLYQQSDGGNRRSHAARWQQESRFWDVDITDHHQRDEQMQSMRRSWSASSIQCGRERERERKLVNVLHFVNHLRVAGKLSELTDELRVQIRRYTNDFGPEHPSTLTLMGELAAVLQKRGSTTQLEEAEQLLRYVIKHRERVLGPEHFSTLNSVNNLAMVLEDKHESPRTYKEAKLLYEQVLAAQKRAIGRRRPGMLVGDETTACRTNFARISKKLKEMEQASNPYGRFKRPGD